MKPVTLLLCIALALAGCHKRIFPDRQMDVRDTVWSTKTVTIRDTVFTVPSDWITVTIPAGNKDTIRKKGKRSALTVTPGKSGSQLVDCECDSAAIAAQLKDTHETQQRKTTIVRTEIQERRYVPGVVKVLAWIGGTVLLIGIFFGVKKIWF